MEFGLSKEQTLLQESVARYFDRSAPLERVRRFVDDREQRASEVWQGFCELDAAALTIAEEHGGLGLSLLDAALVAEVLGSRVAPVPFAATAVMVPLALTLAGSQAQQRKHLPQLASGGAIAGAALGGLVSRRDDAGVHAHGATLEGRALFVLDFEADFYLVAAEDRTMYLVESSAPGLTRRLLPTIDGTRRLGELVFSDLPAELLPRTLR